MKVLRLSDALLKEAAKAALAGPNVRKYVPGEPKKAVFVLDRLVKSIV